MPEISSRMMMAAKMVRPGKVVADVGTDHGYLAAYLIVSGVSPKVIASDLRKGPIENAHKTIEKYGINDKVDLRLSDGLSEIKPDEVDDIVLCGMGGNLIEDILKEATWLKSSRYRLILQPQSHSEDVRRFLVRNGFNILYEDACVDSDKLYSCMCAEYTGIINDLCESFYYVGKLPECGNAFATEIMMNTLKRLRIKREAANNYGSETEYEYYRNVVAEIEELLNDYS